MRISDIVCTLNRPDDLLRLVRSIVGQHVLPDEIIVVDASGQEIREANRRSIEHELTTRGIRFEHVVSPSASLPLQRNLGIDRVSGDLLFFVDDDVILGPDFHEKMVSLHRRYRADGVAGIQPAFAGRAPSLRGRIFWAVFHPQVRRRQLKQYLHLSGDPRVAGPTRGEEVLPVEWLSGACMSFQRDVVHHFRFDETLKGYAALEDVDFSYRVSKSYRLVRAQRVSVDHAGSAVARINPRQLAEMRMLNRHYLFRKNIPQTPMTRLAYSWASVGHLVRACLETLVTGEAGWTLGTGRGLWQVCRGATLPASGPDAQRAG